MNSSLPVKLKLLIAVLITIFCWQGAAAQASQPWSQNTSPLPAPTGFVNDYAGVIDAATKQQLEAKLKDLRDTSDPSVEIAVVVVDTTGGRDIFDYSLAVARGWGIGSKDDDNPSALLLVAIKDRKYFTQISKDLEDELPDGLVGSLQRQYLVPEFRRGNYGKGISDTIDAYIATIRKTNLPAATREAPGSGTTTRSAGSGLFCCALIFIVIMIIILSRSKGGRSKDDHDRWGGGGFGGGGSSALPWIIGSIIASGGSGSSSSDSWGGSSSDWGGSSGGWGGFGGGGDFGGGGAGGDW